MGALADKKLKKAKEQHAEAEEHALRMENYVDDLEREQAAIDEKVENDLQRFGIEFPELISTANASNKKELAAKDPVTKDQVLLENMMREIEENKLECPFDFTMDSTSLSSADDNNHELDAMLKRT